MDTNSAEKLKQIISAQTTWFFTRLESFSTEKQLVGKLTHGYWPNIGWISYFPHNLQDEESIELLFSFSKEANNGGHQFEISISWSDGSVIQTLVQIDNIKSENIESQIDEIIEASRTQSLFEMEKQMMIDRPPRYREG